MSAGKQSQIDILKLLQKKDFDPTLAVERQVSEHVRQLILGQQLERGIRLPSIRTLAKTWDSNYFTIQAALRKLVKEGLLVQTPKLGTFVANNPTTLRSVCLYHMQDLKFGPISSFYSSLNIQLYRLLSEQGITTISHFDHRPTAKQDTTPIEIREMIQNRQINAIIMSWINTPILTWATKIPIPWVDVKAGAYINFEKFTQLAIQKILLSPNPNKETVCISYSPQFASLIESKFQQHHIPITTITRTEEHKGLGAEEIGYLLTQKILKRKKLPTTILSYPDSITRGIIQALLTHNIQIPQDLELISHRNKEIPIFSPFPITWITVKVEDFAHGMIKNLEAQIAGQKLSPIPIEPSLE